MSLGTAICSLGTAASLPEVLLVWVTILPEIVVASLRIIRGDSGTGTKGAADVPSVVVASPCACIFPEVAFEGGDVTSTPPELFSVLLP